MRGVRGTAGRVWQSFTIRAHAQAMSMPATHAPSPIADFIERHDTLRTILEWIHDRLADAPAVDDTIDWEDGEEHEDDGPMAA